MKGLRAAPARKDLGILVDEKLHISRQCVLPVYPGLHQKQRGQETKGGDSAPLLRSGESPPGVLPPALEPSAQERHGPVAVGPQR